MILSRHETGMSLTASEPRRPQQTSDQELQLWALTDSNRRPLPCKGSALAI